jgi:DNA uptake protein ComE-like DNA-binding protein
MEYKVKKNSEKKHEAGSALILAVVLSTLLALVGVLFLMTARINKMGTSAISENKELDFAVDSVVAEISQQLALDVPGMVNPNQEYYDCPDSNNQWLASLEPYKSGTDYYWYQISDITGQLTGKNRNVKTVVVSPYAPVSDTNNPAADADGEGIADSRWVALSGISSSQGKPIYAAIRIIDNGAMLNVNTGFKFNRNDPNALIFDIDGKNQTQINLMALAGWAGDPPTSTDERNLLYARTNNGVGVNPYDLQSYLRNFVWNYSEPNGPYTPFDLSDELEIRYRFLLNNTGIDTRLETWGDQFRDNTISTPVTSGGASLDSWFQKAFNNGTADPNYSYRHLATIYNMDRIINPVGLTLNNGKMVNINTAAPQLLYDTIKTSLQDKEPNALTLERLSAQLALNIVDLRDKDTDVSSLTVGTNNYYGFESQPFISEIGFKISDSSASTSANNNFAIELYNPFKSDILLSNFQIELCDSNDNVANTVNMPGYILRAESRFVITNSSSATNQFNLNTVISSGAGRVDPNLILAKFVSAGSSPPSFVLSKKYNIHLIRKISGTKLYLDKQNTQSSWFTWQASNSSKFYSRSDLNWNIIYQELTSSTNTLGTNNAAAASHKNYNLANSTDFYITIGDIARTLIIGPAADINDTIGEKLADEPNEYEIRMDLANPFYANLFKFLTVMDPTEHGSPPAETRIKGRININTAPWFTMAQLPWMEPSVAQAIVSFRNSSGAFKGIGDLMRVPQMSFYATDPAFKDVDLDRWPDLTPNDGAISDFEERDLIFSRISNLITVRSDVFTAYILVRIGLDGPQKRAVAIFDRSNVTTPGGKVRLLALQSVPDPR